MDANEIARRTLAGLTARGLAPLCPYLLVGREVFSPDDLQRLDMAAVRERWPNDVFLVVYSYRGYSAPRRVCVDPSVWVFARQSWEAPIETPLLLFWPPRHAAAPPEFLFSWNDDDSIVADALVWLLGQKLPNLAGPRQTVKFYASIWAEPVLLQGEPLTLD